ncbi:MAG TPA: SPOR domain-containing protein [Thermoanaerobaculia bacterium]|nr:SPOR domain-containing protein [Thermoanaerobaculia bacterium]
MKRLTSALFLLLAAFAAQAAERAVRVPVRGSQILEFVGVTAAYSIDANIADASLAGNEVTIFGRSPGTTQVIVVSITGQTAFNVTVEPPRSLTATTKRTDTDGTIETRYSTAAQQVTNSVNVVRQESATRRTEVHVEVAHYGEEAGVRASSTLPAVSYRIFTGSRELTLLDRVVDHSPLTASNTIVRGIHYLDDHWRIHAGRTAYAAYQSFLLPAESDTVLGAAYAFDTNARTRITPGLFIYPDADDDRRGAIASMLVDYRKSDALAMRGELAVSRGIGGAFQLDYDRERERAHVDLRYRPRRFPTATPGEPRGFFADAAWSRDFARGSSADASFSANQYFFRNFEQRTINATTNVRLRATDHLSFVTGASFGSFDDTHTITIPAGVQLDYARFGVSALARWSRSSATNEGAPGFRIAARASAGHFFGNVSIDYQEQAPTLALIFREQPDLALALAELGIRATSAADIARALRENSALIDLGYIEGITVDLAPSRTTGTMELAWLGSGAARPQLRARLLYNRIDGVATSRDTVIATLSASRRLTDATDVFASYSWWMSQQRGGEQIVQPIFEAGVRHRFDELPSIGGGHGTIAGVVFVDEDLDGRPDAGATPESAEVELDGTRRAETARDGSFSFANVQRGAHQVVARVPRRDAYFTTPSRVEAQPGERVSFGVAFTPARLFGTVTSDAGNGVGNVLISLTRGPKRLETTSASDGTFSFSAAPGEWNLAVDTATLPAGYTSDANNDRAVQLDREQPQQAAMALRANRSISGHAPAGITSIVVEPLGRSVPVAADGRFTIRSLPAGEVTLRAGATTRTISLPRDPALITGVDLGVTAPVAVADAPAVIEHPFSVQLGTFRIEANALELVERAQKNGIDAHVVDAGDFTVVRSGAYASRDEAASVVRQLERLGIPAVVVRGR